MLSGLSKSELLFIVLVDPQPSVPSVDNSAAEQIEQQRRQAEQEQAEAERARQFEERRAMIEQQQKAAAAEMEKLRLEKEEKERQEQQASTVAANAVPSSLDVDTNGTVEQREAQPVVSPSDGLCAVAQFDYTAGENGVRVMPAVYFLWCVFVILVHFWHAMAGQHCGHCFHWQYL